MLALLLLVIVQSADAQSTLRRSVDDVEIDIWTDRDDGSNYYEGDDVWIYFRASADCYVVVYDLDTRGNVNLIFPEGPRARHFIKGDEIYMIPDRWSDYTLTLEGPPGYEHIQIVASRDYFPVPEWYGPVSVYDEKTWGFKYEGDNEKFISQVNWRFFPQNAAFDQVTFYVAPRYYYEPEKVSCSGSCGRVYIDYPSGCEVYVNGVFYGYAPLYIPAIYTGRHRVTVYWGSSILYNDWILIDPWAPFFIYPRHVYVYDYFWTRWYRHYVWDYYYYGPSYYKYKIVDGYRYKKPEIRRGYRVVSNDHKSYTKAKVYSAEKVKRIENYKTAYKFDRTTKTYTASKPQYVQVRARPEYPTTSAKSKADRTK